MTMAAVAAAVVGAGIAAGLGYVVTEEQNKRKEKMASLAQQKAMEDDRKQAFLQRKQQAFEETQGQGLGTQGQVSLTVDKNIGDGKITDSVRNVV